MAIGTYLPCSQNKMCLGLLPTIGEPGIDIRLEYSLLRQYIEVVDNTILQDIVFGLLGHYLRERKYLKVNVHIMCPNIPHIF